MTTTRPTSRTAVTNPLTVADAMEPCEYQIADDSGVERVDDIFHHAHVDYLVVRGHDGRCAGLVTRRSLRPFLDLPRSGEHVTIHGAVQQRGPFAWPSMALALAALAMRIKRLVIWPVIDDDGYVLGIITAQHVDGMMAHAPA
ncbi:hypothetical protein KNE206_78340 [Kitasatospora sp. NE20-6]|uniref:CBS domain-containing protein n=1 Tax=Kitasatospora sp. NE20-6 TaxID=2859066 RepID=UPI0034DC79E2